MFNGIWLIADEPLTSQGRSVAAGETFHISRVHAGALLVTKQARVLHPQPPPKARIVEPEITTPRRMGRPRRKPVADTPDLDSPDGIDPDATPEPIAYGGEERRYRRRDLEAGE